MKLALCLEYPIEQPGGTEVLVRELIHGLAARHQIVLVSGDSELARLWFERGNVEGVFDGDVEPFMEAYLRWRRADAASS